MTSDPVYTVFAAVLKLHTITSV